MKKIVNLKVLFGLTAVLFFVFGIIQPAHAYLDPGSGSAILQGLIAGFVAIGVVTKLYWHRLLKMLGFRKDVDIEKK